MHLHVISDKIHSYKGSRFFIFIFYFFFITRVHLPRYSKHKKTEVVDYYFLGICFCSPLEIQCKQCLGRGCAILVKHALS